MTTVCILTDADAELVCGMGGRILGSRRRYYTYFDPRRPDRLRRCETASCVAWLLSFDLRPEARKSLQQPHPAEAPK